jgi:hypothetical protein
MTAKNSSSLVITDPQVAAVLIKDNVAAYLAQFIGKENSIHQAAIAVNAKINAMAYWVKRFLEFGLINITRIESRGGSAIKHYQSVATEFLFAADLLEGFGNAEILAQIMQRDYNRFTRSVAAFGTHLTPDWRLRVFGDAYGYGVDLEPVFASPPQQPFPKKPLHDWATITMTAEKASEFRSELEALFERFKASTQAGSDAPRFIMHVGFVKEAP